MPSHAIESVGEKIHLIYFPRIFTACLRGAAGKCAGQISTNIFSVGSNPGRCNRIYQVGTSTQYVIFLFYYTTNKNCR